VGTLRGKRFYYDETEIPIIVTYHPAYLLRSPQEKRKAWQDLLFARETYSAL
jgi:uracil-DNA glycosylase family 4